MHYDPPERTLSELADFATCRRVGEQIASSFNALRHGDLPKLLSALDALPRLPESAPGLAGATVEVGKAGGCTASEAKKLESILRSLGPWRKGPFEVFGIRIDAEWRCDMKWKRVAPHVAPLGGRSVLDVGCGNGYYCLRMLGAGARRVLGLEPNPRFLLQFEALRRLMPPLAAHVLPLRLEDLPADVADFDTVFSMGVLYHRRSAAEHLQELHRRLAPRGQLVLETLTLPQGSSDLLILEDRYANMRNVWAIPSRHKLLDWVHRAGFSNPRIVSTAKTTVEEQRSTPWMPLHSLAQALEEGNGELTVEGHPAPRRSVVVAQRP
jgi:tRNA (mo5U34)-methyltransferase